MHIDADREPPGTVRRCHAVEQRERLRGRLDAVHAHIAPQLDGDSELCLDDGELVCEGRHEWRQPAATSIFISIRLVVSGVERTRTGKGDTCDTVDADFAEHRGGKLGEVRTHIGEDVGEGYGLREGGEQTREGGLELGAGGRRRRLGEEERAVVGGAVRDRACGCAQGYPVCPPGVVAKCGDDAIGMGPRERGDSGLVLGLRRHCAERAWEGLDGGCRDRGTVRRVAVNVNEVSEDLGCRRHDGRDKVVDGNIGELQPLLTSCILRISVITEDC